MKASHDRGEEDHSVIGRCALAFLSVVLIVVTTAGATNSPQVPRGYEQWRANSLSLNGTWEFSPGDGSERAETAEGANRLAWKPVTIPGSVVEYQDPSAARMRFAWVRRTFTVSAEQAQSLAVLRWNQITFGAVAYLNGEEVGENAPTGPYQVMLAPGTLQAGENSIALKIAGGQGAPKAKSGSLLIPAGLAIRASRRGFMAMSGSISRIPFT